MVGPVAVLLIAACGSTATRNDADGAGVASATTDAISEETVESTPSDAPPMPMHSRADVRELAGELVWSTNLGLAAEDGTPVVVGASDETVIVSTVPFLDGLSGPSVLTAVDAATGEVRWSVEREASWAWNRVTVVDEVVVFVEVDGSGPDFAERLAAVDLVTGDRVWASALEGRTLAWFEVAAGIVAFDGDQVVGLDPATGEEDWVVAPGQDAAADRPPLVRPVVVRSNGMIAFVSGDPSSALIGVGHDGTERWRRNIDDWILLADHLPAASAETVALPIDGMLTGLDLVTGEERWAISIDEIPDETVIRSDPAGVAVVCVADRGVIALIAVDLEDGSLRWEQLLEPSDDGVVGAADVVGYADDVIMTSVGATGVGGCEPRANAFSEISVQVLSTGQQVWSRSDDGGPTLFPGGLFAPTWTDSPVLVGDAIVLLRSGDEWSVHDAVTGDVAVDGTVEAGFGVSVHGPYVVTADGSSILGTTGSVDIGEIVSIPGWGVDQLYVWAGDGVLSAVR